MDIIRLRTLTFKSTMKFGQYAELDVARVIELGKSTYLKWVYFNIEGISFTDEVLDYLKIWPEYRIQKPGKDPEIFEQILKGKYYKFLGIEGLVSKSISKKRYKARVITNQKRRAVYSSKGYLQAKNHGKFR